MSDSIRSSDSTQPRDLGGGPPQPQARSQDRLPGDQPPAVDEVREDLQRSREEYRPSLPSDPDVSGPWEGVRGLLFGLLAMLALFFVGGLTGAIPIILGAVAAGTVVMGMVTLTDPKARKAFKQLFPYAVPIGLVPMGLCAAVTMVAPIAGAMIIAATWGSLFASTAMASMVLASVIEQRAKDRENEAKDEAEKKRRETEENKKREERNPQLSPVKVTTEAPQQLTPGTLRDTPPPMVDEHLDREQQTFRARAGNPRRQNNKFMRTAARALEKSNKLADGCYRRAVARAREEGLH